MSNIYSEVFLIIFGMIFLIKFGRIVWKDNSNIKIIFMITYLISVIIILMSKRGSMYFGDGYDYYVLGQRVLKKYGRNLGTFLNYKNFISVCQSWHFIPVYEFALFDIIFKSTKCISIFHIILMHVSAGIWYKNFLNLKFGKKNAETASIIMLLSLYLYNYTIPALKDPLVYFLSTIISYFLVKYIYDEKLRYIIYTIIPIIVTRMYVATSFCIAVIICCGRYVLKKKKYICIYCISIVSLLLIVSIFAKNVIAYIFTWIKRYDMNLVELIINMFKRCVQFCFAPLIINIGNAQPLYYPTYIDALIRLLGIGFLIKGLTCLRKYQNKFAISIIFVIPLLLSMIALETGEQFSSVRQYFQSYPILCILYSIGINNLMVKKSQDRKRKYR